MFYEYKSSYSAFKQVHSKKELKEKGCHNEHDFFIKIATPEAVIASDNPITYRLMMFDANHFELKRPYYHVYSPIIPILTKVDLDLTCNHIKPPQGIQHLLLKLQEGNSLNWMDGDKYQEVHTIFFSFQKINKTVGSREQIDGLVIGVNIGETVFELGAVVPVHTLKIFPLTENPINEEIAFLEEHLSSLKGIQIPHDITVECVKLVATVCLLGNDPNILQAKPLSKDVPKYENANLQVRKALVEKAHRKGVVAFDLGKDLDTTPHYRNGCMALYWTGVGRKTPIIRWRAGGMVNKKKITDVPTGYDG